MRTLVIAAALLGSSAAIAQTSAMTTTADGQQVQGATTQVLAKGDHYTVHRVMPDGTVMVQTLTGDQAELAMKGEFTPPLATGAVTQGAGTATTEPTQN